jgi:uncharacterized protein
MKTTIKNLVSQTNPRDTLFVMSSIFLLVLSIGSALMLVKNLGKSDPSANDRIINVTASGEAYQTPDIANFTYNVFKEGKDVATTQADVTERTNAITKKLLEAGIEKKDINTRNISANPKYEWQIKPNRCPVGQYCPQDGKNVLVGYQSSVSMDVRVRDLEKSGKILQILGESNVTDLSGPNFGNEDKDKALNEARNAALAKARVKARDMAKAMGVRLGKVVTFTEGSNGGMMPMMARTEMATMVMGDAMVKSAPTLDISAGQQKVSVDVVVTYRIK